MTTATAAGTSDRSTDPSPAAAGRQAAGGELGAFLRSRRARLSAAEVGLAPGPRRRTPGLRREEVAQLSGVGLTWYTWLEQGRAPNASAQVLDAVARTLRLDAAETDHLFRLAGATRSEPPTVPTTVSPTLRAVLAALEPSPAYIVSDRFDVLAWNPAAVDLITNFEALPPEDRNIVWLAFTRTWFRSLVDWDREVDWHVAQLRANSAGHVGEPYWDGFIQRLLAVSPDFSAKWAARLVAGPAERRKSLMHPRRGMLHLNTTPMLLPELPGTRMMVFTPADDATAERLRGPHGRWSGTRRDPDPSVVT